MGRWETLEAGAELDALVAEKVMGWDVKYSDPTFRNDEIHWRDPFNKTIYRVGEWSPSSNIAAAWEVVKKMALAQYQVRLSNKSFDDRWWWCYFDGGKLNVAQAHTVPLAICRAALKAVE